MSPNCIDVERIADVESSPELKKHVDDCPRCQSLWLSYQSFMTADVSGAPGADDARRSLEAVIRRQAGQAVPAHAVPRVYVVTARGTVDDASLETLSRGITIDGALVTPRRVTLRKRSGRETHLLVEIVEGRNREIRRLFAAIGHDVTRLLRVSFGGVELGTLPPGRWRPLTYDELRTLRGEVVLR